MEYSISSVKSYGGLIHRVCTGPGNPGKSWNFILAFSRTGKSWKINAGPGKSWKAINSYKNVFFINSCLQYSGVSIKIEVWQLV